MQPAQDRGLRKAGRDIFQSLIAVVAGGGATAVIGLIAGGFNPLIAAALIFLSKWMVTYAQNYLETKGSIGVLLPSPGLITTTAGGTVGHAVGTVDTVVQATGEGAERTTAVVGEVLDTAGKAVGGVAGAVGGLLGDVENLGGI